MTDVRVTMSGPLFDGRAQRAMRGITADIVERLAVEGERRWLAGLTATLRKPTGAYVSRIDHQSSATRSRVHDNRGIYGPWLEGTGSRNKTTRFKGYANARKATQQLEAGAPHLAEQVIREHLSELGG
jgi:hypothetical protein